MSNEKVQGVTGIIDAHVHLIDKGRFQYPWLEAAPPINRSHLVSDYLNSYADFSIEKFIFIEACVNIEDSIAEAEWMANDVARDTPQLGAIVAQACVERGAAVQEQLDKLSGIPLVTGVRRVLAFPFQNDLDFCIQPEFIAGVQLLAEYDYSFDIGARIENLPNVIEMIKLCPNIRFVLNHIGKPEIEQGLMEPWRTYIEQLADFDNVKCKAAGLLLDAGKRKSADNIKPYIFEVLDLFGVDRVIFGSDFPVHNLNGTSREWIAIMRDICRELSDGDRAKIFHDNAQSTYRIA